MIQSLAHEMNFDKGEAGDGGKPAKRSARKSLMNCPCREPKAEVTDETRIKIESCEGGGCPKETLTQ
jgi:hypothetical protein